MLEEPRKGLMRRRQLGRVARAPPEWRYKLSASQPKIEAAFVVTFGWIHRRISLPIG